MEDCRDREAMTMVYIYAVEGVKSGGPELVEQVNRNGFEAFM